MENMSKALLISAGVLVSIIVLSILVYEIAATSSIAHSIQEKQYEKRIDEFNAQFEGFASRNTRGYLGIDDAISVQEFAKIYDMALEWNKSNPSEKIKITVNISSGAKIRGVPVTTATVSPSVITAINPYLLDLQRVPLSDETVALPPIENLLRKMGGSDESNDIQKYFFEFKAENIEYSSLTKRVKSIKMSIKKV